MDDKLNTELIRQILNRSLDNFDHSTLARLHEAHFKVMHRLQSRSKRFERFAWTADHAILHLSVLRQRTLRWTGTIFLAASLLIGIAYWQQATDDDGNNEDISILTGDLPIQYYAD